MRVFFLILFFSSFLHGLEFRSELMPFETINSDHQIETICYSKNGRILFVGTAGRGATSSIEFYKDTGEKLDATFINPEPVEVFDASPDNRKIAYGCNDACKVLDLETGNIKTELRDNPNNRITSLEYDNEGNRLLLGYKNGVCKILDMRMPKVAHTLEAHSGEVYCARWCIDNSHLATLGTDKTIKLWDCKGYGLVKVEKKGANSPVTLAFNPITDELICAGLNIYVYEPIFAFSQVFNLQGKQEPTGGSRLIEDPTKPKAHSLAFIPGNKDYVIAGINDGSVCLCDRSNPKQSVVLNAFLAEKLLNEQTGKALAVSPNGQTLAVGSYFDSMVRLWKIEELLPHLKRSKELVTIGSAHKTQKNECCVVH